jgi:hypothetical protein
VSSRHDGEPDVADLLRRYATSIRRTGLTLMLLVMAAVGAGVLAAAEPNWPRPVALRALCGFAGIAALGTGMVLLVLLRARAKLRRLGG